MTTTTPPLAAASDWWRRAVIYQIYIRSFSDGNGDGIGDIAGIRSRLPYLRGLGVDAVWITPWYPSPMADGGYDVADYRGIDPRFGTLGDARALIAEAHAAGLRVIIDIVPNHTSVEHAWFREAWAAPRGSAARARYLFRDGRGPAGDEPPNNWQSAFGGRAWSPAPDDGLAPRQWYLHLFDSSQPDLDWSDPEVRAEFESILEFWLDQGVDGFRIDVAFFLCKAAGLPDLTPANDRPWLHPFSDREEVHEVFRGWRRVVDARRQGIVFCGEVSLPAVQIARYLRPDELHTAFNFDFALRLWEAAAFRASIDETLATHAMVGATPTWVIGNHDLPRPAYRYGREAGAEPFDAWSRRAASDQERGARRARAAALLSLALPGSAYVYQGDELGLPEVLDLAADVREDPTFRRSGGLEVGRDGDRVPLPWSGDAPPYGFGPAGSRPWLPQPEAWRRLSVEAEDATPGSTLALYRAALALRRTEPGFGGVEFAWQDAPAGILRFARGAGLQVAVNLSGDPVALPAGRRTLLATDPGPSDLLPADAAEWFVEVPA